MLITLPAGTRIADTDSKLAADDCAAFLANGFPYVGRYISRTSPQNSYDLTTDEVATIFGAGLGIVLIQHVREQGWMPSAALGSQMGAAAAANASDLGAPPGVVIWMDLEGVSPDATPGEVEAHCNSWTFALSSLGYVAGLYVGANDALDAYDLYNRLTLSRYWHGGSRSAPVPVTRGVCMVQTIDPSFSDPVPYDSNLVQADNLGGLPVGWTADPATTSEVTA